MRQYAVRIIINTNSDGKRNGVVTFGTEAARRLREERDATYVSLKRMNDRLAFVPWDNKGSKDGVVLLSKTDMLQFSRPDDLEMLEAFEGEYDGLLENGRLFYVVQDKVRPWTTVLPARKPAERTEKPVERTNDAQTTNAPLEALKALASELRRKAEQADEDRREAEKLRDEAVARIAEYTGKAIAIEEAIKIMEEG